MASWPRASWAKRPRAQRRRRQQGRRRITTDPAPSAPLAPGFLAEADQEDEPETGPLRRCIVTRERLAKQAMIRFVIGPDRSVVPDLAARLPGRGIWLSARGDVVETARAKGGFARAARGPVTVPADLACILRAGLVRRITEFLGLARRAGQAVAGFEKAQALTRGGRAGLVVQALDGSAEECARFLSGATPGLHVVAPLDAAALGAVFGRERVVHVAIVPGRLADALADETARLTGIRTHAAGSPPGGPRGSPAGRPAGREDKAAGGDAGETRGREPAEKRGREPAEKRGREPAETRRRKPAETRGRKPADKRAGA